MRYGRGMRLTALALALCCLGGCALDRAGLGAEGADATPTPRDAGPAGLDASRVDAAGEDSGRPLDGSRGDAGSIDASGIDAGRLDAGRPDAGRPDAGRPDAGPRRCRDIYGTAPSYIECFERGTECEFYVDLDSATPSCADVCRAFGGMCLRTYREAETSPATCDRLDGTIRPCADPHDDEICVCTR